MNVYVCVYVTMQYRQYAAVLLRKRLVKLWKKLDDDTHSKYIFTHRHCQLFAVPSNQKSGGYINTWVHYK